MISRMLIAVDGSAHSIKAVAIGSQIAAAMNASLVLLHVVKLERIPDAIREFAKTEQLRGSDVDVLVHSTRKLLESEADKARAVGVGKVEIEVVKGPVARTIASTAKRYGAEMIVLGSRGTGDLEGLLLGGVSHRVETLAKCSVLVVK